MLSSPCNPPRFHRAIAPLPALVVSIAALYCGTAAAALSDTIHPFVSLGYSHDDNLLRLPDDTPAGAGPRGDTIRQLQGGLLFERTIGRQVLSGQAKVSRVSFDHYDELNYNGRDFLAALEWHVANHLSGNLGASYAQTLTPFTDSHNSQRNLRVQRRQYADANWRLHPSWQVHASVSREKFSYDLLAQRFNNRIEDSSAAGIDYLAASGSRFGLVARHLTGEYPNRRTFGAQVLDDGFSQDELKAKVYWTASGVTQVELLAGWARRKHNFYSVRDASGANGRVTAIWRPLGRLRLTAALWREFAVVESNLVNTSLNKGGSLAASWELSAKVKAEATLRRERRAFDAVRGVPLPGEPSDATRYQSLGLTYTPLPALQVGASVFHESRQGEPLAGTGSYRANGAALNVSAQF